MASSPIASFLSVTMLRLSAGMVIIGLLPAGEVRMDVRDAAPARLGALRRHDHAGQPGRSAPAGRKPPYGISCTRWNSHQDHSLVVTAPHLPLLVLEFNRRYLDDPQSIEGMQLTMFHGLGMLGYEAGDCGYEDLLDTYRSIFQHPIRPAMHRRFTRVEEHHTPREPFRSRPRAWADVADDLWFTPPELGARELATLTGLASLETVGDGKERHRLFRVSAADRPLARLPLVDMGDDADTRMDDLLALATENWAVLATGTGHWFMSDPISRPSTSDLGMRRVGSPCDSLHRLGVIRAPCFPGAGARHSGHDRLKPVPRRHRANLSPSHRQASETLAPHPARIRS